MGVKLLIFAILSFIGMTLAAPFPHTGMINDEHLRDVGAVYPKPGYEGAGTFLLQVKDEPRCISLDKGIGSIQICIPASCTFYTTGDCSQDKEGSSFTVNGPGDVHDVPVPEGNYASYICGTDESMFSKGDVTLATTPHDSSKDIKAGMILATTLHDKTKELKPDN